VHHIPNPHKAFAVQICARAGKKGERKHGLLAGLPLSVPAINTTTSSAESASHGGESAVDGEKEGARVTVHIPRR
jgi:hypothetical protein